MPVPTLADVYHDLDDYEAALNAGDGTSRVGPAAVKAMSDTITVLREPVGAVAPALIPAFDALLAALAQIGPIVINPGN